MSNKYKQKFTLVFFFEISRYFFKHKTNKNRKQNHIKILRLNQLVSMDDHISKRQFSKAPSQMTSVLTKNSELKYHFRNSYD